MEAVNNDILQLYSRGDTHTHTPGCRGVAVIAGMNDSSNTYFPGGTFRFRKSAVNLPLP